jgi:hypothetical protein
VRGADPRPGRPGEKVVTSTSIAARP